jgi:hypothetical protein
MAAISCPLPSRKQKDAIFWRQNFQMSTFPPKRNNGASQSASFSYQLPAAN